MFTGSMCGSGAIAFAVFTYAIVNARPDCGSVVSLNPLVLCGVLGESPEDIQEAIDELCQPDEKSRSTNEDGRRLLKIGNSMDYKVVNLEKYRFLDTADQRAYWRDKKRANRSNDQSQPTKKGYVYYALSESTNELKIGFSTNPWARVSELKTARPDIQIVAVELGSSATERERHLRFATDRLRRSEWFNYSVVLREFVKSLCPNTVVTTNSTVVAKMIHADAGTGTSTNAGTVDTSPYGDVSASKINEEKVRKKFSKPSTPEMELQASKIGLPPTEIDRFFNYYESNGWRVGRNPMKCWKAAMQNWKIHYDQINSRSGRPGFDRNKGTHNEGKAALYDISKINASRAARIQDAERSEAEPNVKCS